MLLCRLTTKFAAVVALSAAGATVLACSSAGETNGPGGDGDTSFESDNPSAGTATPPGGVGAGSGGSSGTGGSGGSGGGTSGDDSADPGRAIEEADIIKIVGDRLYALSRYGGLSIIDASRPDQLELLGRFRMDATPFEMYERGGIVFGLFTSWGKYVRGADATWQWVQTSQVVALDVRDPKSVKKVGEFSIAGDISDSRIVGDVLYVVSHEDGYCYDCASNPRTTVMSLEIADPSAVKKVDQLTFDDVSDQWGWGKRSITVTEKRLYVAGRESNATGVLGSSIQVVDIADPNGDLVAGAKVEASGQISSRWQMDEHEGVLRVLSQPWDWSLETAPSVQTFRVDSSQKLVPIGRTDLVLPRPEQLQSTRFDGPRAYAITFERTDPLFTIDLSDPTQPKQVGELEMPGWVYHMEPRGDRLLGLGFDRDNPEGGLNVSLFDVSNLATPKLIDRVNFGGDWGYLPEDQDRIHKAFQVLDERGLILVPYSGYLSESDYSYCGGRYQSGVQLVDFTLDDLALRGSAPSYGEARRAFIHREHLFTVSDDRVQSFGIADRDKPEKTGQVSLARQVSSTAVIGDKLVRLGNDWWSDTAELDVTSLSQADSPQGLGSVDLQSAIGDSCGYGFYGARVFGAGNRAYVVYEDYSYGYDTYYQQGTAVAVVDVSNPAAPRLESNTPLGFTAYYGWGGWGADSVVTSGEQVVRVGSTLVFLRGENDWDPRGQPINSRGWVDVVDLSDPTAPKTNRITLSEASGITGLHLDGSTVLTSHFEPIDGDPSRVRFYVDRIDVSTPAAPRLLGKINVPGSLFAWDTASRRAITVDYRRSVETNVTAQACYEKLGYRAYWTPNDPNDYSGYRYDTALGSCLRVSHTLKQVELGSSSAELEGSWSVPDEQALGHASVGNDRVFVGLSQSYYGYAGDCFNCSAGAPVKAPLLVLSGLTAGKLEAATIDLASEPWGGYIHSLTAFGDRVLASANYGSDFVVVDASNAESPRVERTVDAVGYVTSVEKHGDFAILASGYDGVQVLDMSR